MSAQHLAPADDVSDCSADTSAEFSAELAVESVGLGEEALDDRLEMDYAKAALVATENQAMFEAAEHLVSDNGEASSSAGPRPSAGRTTRPS